MAYTTLKRPDLKKIEGSATTLVLEAQRYGWLGEVNPSGTSAVLRSPDGGTLIRVGRGSGSPVRRSRLVLDRWVKERGGRHV